MRDELDQRLRHSAGVKAVQAEVRAAVLAGELTAPLAADRLLAAYDEDPPTRSRAAALSVCATASAGKSAGMGFADPDQLEELAGQIEGKASDVREECGRFADLVANVTWQSAGAEDYRGQCDGLRLDLLADADGLDAAAAALRRHAAAVRDRIEWIQDRIADLRHLAEEGVEITQDMIDDIARFGGDVAGEVQDAVDDMLSGLGDFAGGVRDTAGDVIKGIGGLLLVIRVGERTPLARPRRLALGVDKWMALQRAAGGAPGCGCPQDVRLQIEPVDAVLATVDLEAGLADATTLLRDHGVIDDDGPVPAVAANLAALGAADRRLRISLAGPGVSRLGYYWVEAHLGGSLVRDGLTHTLSLFDARALGTELLDAGPRAGGRDRPSASPSPSRWRPSGRSRRSTTRCPATSSPRWGSSSGCIPATSPGCTSGAGAPGRCCT